MSLFKQYLEMAQKAIPLKKPKNFKNQLEDVIDRLVKNQDHKNKKTIKIHTSNLGFQGKFDTHFADAIYQLKDAYKRILNKQELSDSCWEFRESICSILQSPKCLLHDENAFDIV